MEKMEKDHDHCWDYKCCGGRSLVWRLLRVMAGAAVILLILALGVVAGRKQALRRLGYSGSEMEMGWGDNMKKMGLPLEEKMSDNMMFFRKGETGTSTPGMMIKTAGTRIAGIVTAINGAQITLVDNGGATQTMYSTADTVILSPTGEQPLSAIKVKQFIVGFVIAKDGKNMAHRIQLQQ